MNACVAGPHTPGGPAEPGAADRPPAPPLWQLLQACAAALAAMRAGASGTVALDQVDAALRPAVQALFFQVLRSLARARNLRSQLAARAPPPATDALLCVVLALGWRASDAPYAAFTLVNQAVEAAKRSPATKAQAAFVNGCLRRFLRERDGLVARSQGDLEAVWNHPLWWIRRLQHDHPRRWQQVLQADRRQAPMTLRVNARMSTRDAYLQELRDSGVVAFPCGPFGVRLQQALPVQRVAGFDAGRVSVQDAAAQMAAPLLLDSLGAALARPHEGRLRVLDACAAPGGKTAHLLELAECEVTALELDAHRSQRIHATLQRLGLQARVAIGDAGRPDTWWDGLAFDAILLDAPCTASGIVRRRPDVPWLRREADVARLAGVQARLLRSLWPLLKVGGRLLYCTCSVFRSEGSGQIETFLAHNTDALLRPSPGHLLPQFAENGEAVPDNLPSDHDGFFFALLEKRAP